MKDQFEFESMTIPFVQDNPVRKKGPERKSFQEAIKDFLHRLQIDCGTECWNWPGAKQPASKKSKKHYGVYYVLGRKIPTHIFSHELFVGLVPSWLVVAHKCDNTLCCNPRHLHIVPHRENMREAFLRKTFARGVNAACVKLTTIQVELMRDLYYSALLDLPTLGELFGIKNTWPTITGEHWPDVPMPQSAAVADLEAIRQINNGRAQSKVSFQTALLIHELRRKGMECKQISKLVGLSSTRVAVMTRHGTPSYNATCPEKQKFIFREMERIQTWMWTQVSSGKLEHDLVAKIGQTLTGRFGSNSEGYPGTEAEILVGVSKKMIGPLH